METGDITQAVRSLALCYGLTAVATGERDWLSDGERTIAVDNGHPLLATVTGTGCMATTVIGAMAAVEADPLLAAVAGLVCFGVAATAGDVRRRILWIPAAYLVLFGIVLYAGRAPTHFLWYLAPATWCAILLCTVGVGELGRRVRRWLEPRKAAGALAAAVMVLAVMFVVLSQVWLSS